MVVACRHNEQQVEVEEKLQPEDDSRANVNGVRLSPFHFFPRPFTECFDKRVVCYDKQEASS